MPRLVELHVVVCTESPGIVDWKLWNRRCMDWSWCVWLCHHQADSEMHTLQAFPACSHLLVHGTVWVGHRTVFQRQSWSGRGVPKSIKWDGRCLYSGKQGHQACLCTAGKCPSPARDDPGECHEEAAKTGKHKRPRMQCFAPWWTICIEWRQSSTL